MSHIDVFKKFEELMPYFCEQVEEWFPNGFNSIRVRLENKREYIFTYSEENGFRFEDIGVFIDRTLKGE